MCSGSKSNHAFPPEATQTLKTTLPGSVPPIYTKGDGLTYLLSDGAVAGYECLEELRGPGPVLAGKLGGG